MGDLRAGPLKGCAQNMFQFQWPSLIKAHLHSPAVAVHDISTIDERQMVNRPGNLIENSSIEFRVNFP